MKPYLFLHIPKTGGTSIAEVLPSGHTTSRLIQRRLRTITPPVPPEFEIAVNTPGPGHVFYTSKPHHYTHEQYRTWGIDKIKDFDNLYKFTFVRNPWDRVASMFAHFLRTGATFVDNNEKEFKGSRLFLRFVTEIAGVVSLEHYYHQAHGHYTPQSLYTHDSKGEQVVDFIGKYETMQEDLEKLNEICDLGLSEIKIPHLNKTAKEYEDYRKYYSDGTGLTRRIIAEIYAAEIELYGYEF